MSLPLSAHYMCCMCFREFYQLFLLCVCVCACDCGCGYVCVHAKKAHVIVRCLPGPEAWGCLWETGQGNSFTFVKWINDFYFIGFIFFLDVFYQVVSSTEHACCFTTNSVKSVETWRRAVKAKTIPTPGIVLFTIIFISPQKNYCWLWKKVKPECVFHFWWFIFVSERPPCHHKL